MFENTFQPTDGDLLGNVSSTPLALSPSPPPSALSFCLLSLLPPTSRVPFSSHPFILTPSFVDRSTVGSQEEAITPPPASQNTHFISSG